MTAARDLNTPNPTPRPTVPRGSGRTARRAAPLPGMPPLPVFAKKPLPAGRSRDWYESHNRRLKAMRLAIALLDAGIHTPAQARNRAIHRAARRIGVHPPSNTTCRQVRALLP